MRYSAFAVVAVAAGCMAVILMSHNAPLASADGQPAAADPLDVYKPTRKILYKSAVDARGRKQYELFLHVFEPAQHKVTDKTPAIIYFFGGAWNHGEAKTFFPQCDYFASRGIVAISADYRVFSRNHTTPFECVADGKTAVRYLRAHATELGIDPERIVAAGSSAGGHVAACTALIAGLDDPADDLKISCMPNALVLYNPVIDTSLAGYGNERLKERWEEISPVHHVRAGLPPTIVFHGTADKTVPYANAQNFEAKMKAAGNRCTLVSLPNIGHGFAYSLTRKPGNQATRETDEFLESLGYLKGAPTLAGATE